MRSFFATLTVITAVVTLCWATCGYAVAAPPEGAGADRGGDDATRDKPAIERPDADAAENPTDADAKNADATNAGPKNPGPKNAGPKNAGGTLAERRAAAARQKVADVAKRLFPRFDANRDQALDDAEWTKAKVAIDKLVDGEVLKTASNRRELVRDALANMQRPDVQRNGTDVATEAAEQYARDLLAAAIEVAENAQPVVVPVPPPQVGRRGNSDNGDGANNRGRIDRRLPRADATDAERAKEEALRRRGLREVGGKIVPITPGRQGVNPQGGNGPNNGQRPNPPRGSRP
ncbi:MAG: hypothetical protein WD875_11545 [Pirellulales bacterium]